MAGAILSRWRVQATLARTVFLKLFVRFWSHFSRPQIHARNDGCRGTLEYVDAGNTGTDSIFERFTCPVFVSVCGPLQSMAENGGRDGTFERADAGNTGNHRTFVRSCVGSTGRPERYFSPRWTCWMCIDSGTRALRP